MIAFLQLLTASRHILPHPCRYAPPFYCSKLNTPLEFWLAWASMDWADWARTLLFVYSVISFAMSASRMVDSEAWTFSEAVVRLLLV